MNPRTTKAITGHWDSVEIPDHLRYKEPNFVTANYAGVLPRYLSPPKKRIDVDPLEQARQRAAANRPVNPQFAQVEPRYRSPPKAHTPSHLWKPEDEPLPKSVSVRHTTEYVEHKRHAAVFQHVPSKYFDLYMMHTTSGASTSTPREQIDERLRLEKKQISKNGKLFTPIATRGKSPTFGDPQQPPGRKKNLGHSVVMEWVKHGIPIPTSRQDEPPVHHRSSRDVPFFAPGGAGGGSFSRRNTSPTRAAAIREERLIDAIKEKLQHPPRATTDSIKRLSQPRTTSPSRVSPVRGGSPVRTTTAIAKAAIERPHTAASSRRQPSTASNVSTQRPVSPKRVVRTGLASVTPTSPSTPLRTTHVLPRPSSPIQRGPASRQPPSPRTTSPRNVSPIHSSARRDVDVHISVVSDLSELSDTPRINVPSRRVPVLFQSPPHLASP